MIRRSPSRRTDPPPHDWEDLAGQAAFPKPRKANRGSALVDTSPLEIRKIHPVRNPEYLAWLHWELCIGFGLKNRRTDIIHTCWTPGPKVRGHYASDPMHLQKSISGRLKRSDSDAVPGCRHLHDEIEGRMLRAESDYGFNFRQLADDHFARFTEEQEKKR